MEAKQADEQWLTEEDRVETTDFDTNQSDATLWPMDVTEDLFISEAGEKVGDFEMIQQLWAGEVKVEDFSIKADVNLEPEEWVNRNKTEKPKEGTVSISSQPFFKAQPETKISLLEGPPPLGNQQHATCDRLLSSEYSERSSSLPPLMNACLILFDSDFEEE